MIENPMVTGLARDLDRRETREQRVADAYQLLRVEFLEALGERDVAPISTPGDVKDTQPIHDVVFELLACEHDGHTLRQMLYLVTELALQENKAAEAVCESLAHRYAQYHVNRLARSGAFGEDTRDVRERDDA